MINQSGYILRALDKEGKEFFYTGRAGDGWVSADVKEAFDYSGIQAARHKAILFNRRESLTGLWFLVVNAKYGTCA